MTQDPWLAVGKSLAISASRLVPVTGVQPAVEALCGLITLCENVTANRHATRQLCQKCHDLLLAVEKYQPTPPAMLQEAFDDVKKTIEDVKNRAATWSQLSRRSAFVRQKQIQKGIEECRGEISDCFMRYQLASGAETTQWQAEFSAKAQTDHEELRDYICEIHRGQAVLEEVTRKYGETNIQTGEVIMRNMEEMNARLWEQKQDQKDLMRKMQEILAEVSKGSSRDEDQVAGLSRNLYEVQSATKILLPVPNLISGEITDIETQAVARTATIDIYRGRYLQGPTVAIKVVRAVEGDEDTMRRFLREADMWEKIWNIDKGTYILPFYGFSQADERRPYIVSPWQENGTALVYVKKNDARVDYRKLILNIAHGIRVLHCLMDFPVVHGDIQAANILIDNGGNPLLADFGLSKMVEDMTGVPLTQSNKGTNLYRWFAPEIFINNGTMSLASDMYSFAMTILELFTHVHPFPQIKHSLEVMMNVAKGENPERPTEERVVERGLDDKMWQLMTECWNREPSARPGIEEVLASLEGQMVKPSDDV
ncbi:hypothetical protein PM082_002156 [Marasmius tenuissimus]|nr:hypothetical protein PM082_002156 [Marasmius tenuissimus]